MAIQIIYQRQIPSKFVLDWDIGNVSFESFRLVCPSAYTKQKLWEFSEGPWAGWGLPPQAETFPEFLKTADSWCTRDKSGDQNAPKLKSALSPVRLCATSREPAFRRASCRYGELGTSRKEPDQRKTGLGNSASMSLKSRYSTFSDDHSTPADPFG